MSRDKAPEPIMDPGALGTACCLRAGCCGPFGLGSGDVRAFQVFNDLYRFNEIEVEEGFFDTEVSSEYCRLRRYVRPKKPALNWSSLKVGASKGFLVEVGREIDRELLAFQHAMWNAKGDNAIHYPVFMIAQEWREWVMDKFQNLACSHLSSEMIAQRIAWISDAREVGRREIVQLRHSTGWDESAELSLLQVLRDIGRELRSIHDKWRYFQLQQGFSRQAGIICGFLVQLIRCGVRFLHKLLNQEELRLKDAAEGIGKDPGYCCCFGLQKWYANSLYTQIAAWADDVSLWDPTFPVGYLARFFNETGCRTGAAGASHSCTKVSCFPATKDDKVSEIEANLKHLMRKPAVSPFAPWNEDVLSPDEKKLADDVLHYENGREYIDGSQQSGHERE
eukprot:s632_g34.t1